MSDAECGHRYKIGASVSLTSLRGMSRNEGAVYKVTAHLPSDGRHLQYRIRNAAELFERIATENELALRAQ